MNVIRRVVVLLICVVVVSLMFVIPAQAKMSCHKINAKGVGQDLGGNVTTAEITGGGLLHGTTVGNFIITGVAGTVASLAGTVAFTTHESTLIVTVEGTFDVASGAFSASGPVTAATGQLAGATGVLFFTGDEDLSTGRFEEYVSGDICADLAP